MSEPRPDPRIGTDLGPYRIEAVIGRGGMGVVYRATDTSLDRQVALKLIAPLVADDEAFRARFLRESKMAAAIDHPNIIPIYEAGERDGTFFLAMRYVDGADLEHRLRGGPLEARAAVAILGQVASALDAAHAAGLVHRDVKPANLLIASGVGAERDDHVYLTDFGLTKQSGSETGLTRGGGFVGTLEYIAPEQIEGKPSDGRADQYALAGIAVAALTGQAPFPRDSDVALINAHLHDPPPSVHLRRADLPVAVDAVIARGMAKDPASRYPDCRAFVDALRDALGVTATHSRAVAGPTRRAQRPAVVVGGIIVVGLIVIAGFALASGGSAGASPTAPASLAVVPPSASTEVSPTEDVFPNAAEAALLARLPDALRGSCERGAYGVLVGHGGGATPLVSVQCAPAPTSGANEVLIRSFPIQRGATGEYVSGFIASIAGGPAFAPGALTGDGRPIPPGDCASEPRANGRWQLAGEDVGAIACYTVASTGDAYLWWGYDDEQILVRAIDRRGDSAALYDWFEQNARFIAP